MLIVLKIGSRTCAWKSCLCPLSLFFNGICLISYQFLLPNPSMKKEHIRASGIV